MTTLYNVAVLLHSALVLLFVTVTALLLGVSIARRRRTRRVRLAWSSGPLFGLPVTPTLFLIVVLGLIVFRASGSTLSTSVDSILLMGYLLGGIFWYVAALLSASVVVTDWGLSRRARGKPLALPWHEVTDYLVREDRRKTTYILFRLNERGKKERFELEVPRSRRTRFKELVESRLDARFNYNARRPQGTRALKQ